MYIFMLCFFIEWTLILHGANNRKCIWNSMCLWCLLNVGSMKWCSKLCQWLNESRYHHFARSSLTFLFAMIQSRLRAWQCVAFAYFTFRSAIICVLRSKKQIKIDSVGYLRISMTKKVQRNQMVMKKKTMKYFPATTGYFSVAFWHIINVSGKVQSHWNSDNWLRF